MSAMFVLALIHMALDVRYAMSLFVPQYAADPTKWSVTGVANPFLFAVLTIIGDGFMAYRTYIVWGRRSIVLIPPILLLAGMISTQGTAIAAGTFVARGLLSIPHDSEAFQNPFLADTVIPQMTSYFVITLLTNLSITSLLIGRILWVERQTIKACRVGNRITPKSTRRAVMVILQSETAYSVAVVLNLAAYLARSNLVYLTFAALPPLVGISFTLMITSIGLSEMVAAPTALSLSEVVAAAHSPLETLTETAEPGGGSAATTTHEWELPLRLSPVDIRQSITRLSKDTNSSLHSERKLPNDDSNFTKKGTRDRDD
ncbi:hypothetical protein C8Q77DRAFT_1159332 [Trametes polyzona]|nr:hypothetical protein C8Q77DRAFT_1159332 [Trametes polyzona]